MAGLKPLGDFEIAVRLLLGRRAEISSRPRAPRTGGLMGAVVGIGISLIPLLLVLVVSDGMIQGITERYIETKTYHIQVALPDGFSREDAEAALPRLKAIPSVRSVSLETDSAGVAFTRQGSHAATIRSIDGSYFADAGVLAYLKTKEGEAAPSKSRDIVLGDSLARSLGVAVGDTVTVVSESAQPRAALSPSSEAPPAFAPKLGILRVSGIVSTGYRDLDQLWAFVNPDASIAQSPGPSSSTFFGIKISDPFSNDIGITAQRIGEILSETYPEWFEPYLIRTWPAIERNLYRSFGTTKSLLLYIMGVALIVAAVNLGSALTTFVTERSQDIAVMRSFGASDRSLRRIFVSAGLVAGSIGTAIGLAAGSIIAWRINDLIKAAEWIANAIQSLVAGLSGISASHITFLDPAYYLESIPVSMHAGQIAAIGAASIALCVLAALVPAAGAMRVSVQELLRRS